MLKMPVSHFKAAETCLLRQVQGKELNGAHRKLLASFCNVLLSLAVVPLALEHSRVGSAQSSMSYHSPLLLLLLLLLFFL